MAAEYIDDFNMDHDSADEYKPDPFDHLLNVRFYWKGKLNQEASEKEGRPIYRQREFVKIVPMGDRTFSYDGPVNQSHIRRFKQRYDAFKARSETAIEGTPLESWPLVTEAQRLELKYFNIHTVEQLAAVPDSTAGQMFGLTELKRKARKFVDAQMTAAPTVRLQMELAKRDDNIRSLQDQMNKLLEKLGEDTSILE